MFSKDKHIVYLLKRQPFPGLGQDLLVPEAARQMLPLTSHCFNEAISKKEEKHSLPKVPRADSSEIIVGDCIGWNDNRLKHLKQNNAICTE